MMDRHKALLQRLSLTLVLFFPFGSPVLAASNVLSVPAMELIPPNGAAGQTYLLNLFMQVCVANRDHIEAISQGPTLVGWHVELVGKRPMFKITTGRAGWPEIETAKTEYGGMCAIVWTIDPNEGLGSIQSDFERDLHIRLDGQRSTNSPTQTVFNGFGAYDQRGSPQLTLNENVSEKRASYQLALYGKWAK